MDERERVALLQHKDEIAREVVAAERTSDLIYELQESGIITQDTVSYLLKTEMTKTRRVRLVVDELVTCGPGSFTQFLKILAKLGLLHLVMTLDPDYHSQIMPVVRSQSLDLGQLRCTPYHPNGGQPLPSLPRPPHITTPAPPTLPHIRVEVGGDAENNNPSRPLKINVIPYREIGGRKLPSNEVFRNQTMPRGLVFLANYRTFHENVHPTREGSELDVKNLTLLFTQMGYRIPTPRLNMTKYETIKALREFQSLEELAVVDSVVVVVMSHGRDHTSFYTSDNQSLSVNEVVERFSNRECLLLKGKPKIFIFQYCRGSGPDIGVAPRPQPVSNPCGMRVQTDSANFGEAVVHRDPTFTDMYIVYSTVEGFVSFRHPERGSWLMEAICHVFMNHACTNDLDSLMKMVSRRIRQNCTDDGNKQVCEFVQRAFDRHLYFNPEPLSDMTSLNLSSLSRVLAEEGSGLPPRQHLSPTVRRRLRTRSSSREARRRHNSGASNSSAGGSMEDLLNLDPHSEAALVHPRVRSLASNERRISLPNPNILQPTSPRERMSRSCFSESGENLRGATAESQHTQQYRFSHSVSPANPDDDSYDMVDHCPWDRNANITADSLVNKGDDQNHDVTAAADTNNGSHLYSGDVSPMSNESVFTSRESITSRSPSSPEEGEGLVGSRQNSTPGYYPALGTFAGPYGESADAESRYSIKRQLSAPSSKETLEKINDVRRFLQVHDSDPKLLQPLQRIESFVNKKKYEGKRRKVDDDMPKANSQEY